MNKKSVAGLVLVIVASLLALGATDYFLNLSRSVDTGAIPIQVMRDALGWVAISYIVALIMAVLGICLMIKTRSMTSSSKSPV